MRRFSIVFCLVGIVITSRSQSISVDFQVRNELTGKFVDADFEWPIAGKIRKTAMGKYVLTMAAGENGTLTISREGFFDTVLNLNYDTEKTDSFHDIKLKPSIPQLNITIVDQETKEVITSAIDLFTMDESSIVFSDQVEVAPYTIDLEYNEVHVLQVRCPGYFSFKDTIDYKGVFYGRSRERKIALVPLKEGNKVSLNNIYFKLNESVLTEFAQLMLVELTHVLSTNKNLSIEIGAHTDDVGTNEYNLALSEKRANSVKKYLLDKGAQEKQLLAKGYGESTPIQTNDNDANRALNRRVEFRILKVN